MKLPFHLPLGKKEQKDYFLALLLRDEKVTAVIFEEVAAKVHVVGEHETYFPQTIDSVDTDTFLKTIDDAISTAEESLPGNVVTRKTIFGVKGDWVEEAKIKNAYLSKLKKLSDSLGLTPVGFLVIHDAIAHFLQKEEGAPVSAVLVEIDKKQLVVSLLRAGKILETQTTQIEGAIPKTVDTLLHHFNYEVLPSRIILFNGGEEEKLAQSFITHTWNKTLPFLHVPQITPLPKGFDAKAVLFGAATQMGFDLLPNEVLPDVKSHPTESTQKEELVLHQETENAIISEEEKEQAIIAPQDTPEEHHKDKEAYRDQEEEEEERQEEPVQEKTTKKDAVVETTDKPTPFGFVHEDDIIKKQEKPIEEKKEQTTYEEESNIVSVATPPGIHVSTNSSPSFVQKLQQNMPKIAIGSLFAWVPKNARMPFPTSLPKNKKLVFIPPLVVLLLIGLVVFYIVGLKATITLGVTTKSIEKEQDVSFVDQGTTAFSDNLLAGRFIEVTEEASATTDTTGKKEVGEKAKGQVTLYSRFTQEKTLAAGTTVKSSNGTLFTTDDSIKLASAAAGASAQPITTKVNVTAKTIGKESNLPSGTKFTVAGFDISEIEAKNDSAFSGGSKKEITAVAKADQDKLVKEVAGQGEEKAKEAAKQQLKEGEAIIPVFVETTVSEKTFSKDIGDEATAVELKAKVTYTTLAYKESELQILARKVFEESLSNMLPAGSGITYDVKSAEKASEKEIKTTLNLKASLIPKIDRSALQKKVTGVSFTTAETLLKEVPQVQQVTIALQPNIFFLPKTLPRQSQNIRFVIDAHE